MVATVSDSIPTVMTTNNDGGTPPELNQKLTKPGENDAASQPPSVDQMVLDLKRKIAEAAENKSSDATAKGSVE
jgi:hypothetical protein